MQEESNDKLCNQPCPEFEERLLLLVHGELDPGERADVEEHLAHCVGCSASLGKERELLEIVTTREVVQPSAALLASCRASLEDALDREEERGLLRRWVEAMAPARWLVLHPAASAALLIAIGFSAGTMLPRIFRGPQTLPVTGGTEASATNAQAGAIDLDPRSAEVTGISWVPSGDNAPPQIELELKAERPVVLAGTVNNDAVKLCLLNVLRNNEQIDPDVRLDSVELLKVRNNDPEVRSVLCQVVHTDRNPAVRLKALEALNGAEPQEIVRQTLLDALVDDSNPGVRIEAINTLRVMAEKGQVMPDPRMVQVLKDRMQKDPSTYIRLQSAAAIRDLGPREKY